MPAGAGRSGAQAERVAHHGAHREAAEHRALGRDAGALPELVVERGERVVGGAERLGVGVADARHDVPVVAGPARELQRRARGGHVQPPLRVEHVAEPEQVVLVGAAPVVQDEQPLGRAGGGPLAEGQRAHAGSVAADCMSN